MQLYQASHQWATRPADERFTTLEAMHTQTKAYADAAAEKVVPWAELRTEAVGDDLRLVGRAGVPATLTHFAFGQLAARAGAPATYLRDLPATLAAQNLNHGLKTKRAGNAALLFHRNGSLVLRAATSEVYERVWNHEVIARLIDLSARANLVPARTTMGGADNPDGLDLHGNASRALYASDHDMFAFLMSPNRDIQGPLGETLYRGIFVQNSEVGAAALRILGFYFREVCYNHIVWGAELLGEISLRHVGTIREKWMRATVRVRDFLDRPAADGAFGRDLTAPIAGTVDEVLDTLFGVRALGLSRKLLGEAVDAVVPEQDGDPRSRWGIVQGLTRLSQGTAYADERTTLDRAAGRVLELAF